MGFLV